MNCEIRSEFDRLLQTLPSEIQMDLSDAKVRFGVERSIRQKVETMLAESKHQKRILHELFDCGPLVPLIQDETITEIIVNGPASIWFERGGRFFRHDDEFISAFTLSQLVQLICLESRLKLDLNQAFADGTWRGMRVHLAQFPLVDAPHAICLRRHPRQRWTLDGLLEIGWASHEHIRRLQEILDQRWNFLVVGTTGSGKTSVLSALLAGLPESERVVVIEDTDEIRVPNSFSTKLLTRTDLQSALKNYDQSDLVRQSLRMRPARLVVGEVRGGEAKDLLLALSTGHTGSLGTLHASTARQALLRLEMLVQMGAPDWSLDTVRQLILLSLNALVLVEMKDGTRKLEGIYKICSLEKCGFLLEKVS